MYLYVFILYLNNINMSLTNELKQNNEKHFFLLSCRSLLYNTSEVFQKYTNFHHKSQLTQHQFVSNKIDILL